MSSKRIPAALVAALLSVTSLHAQATPSRSVAVGMLHLNVTSLDQSLALFRDVLGMELIAPLAPARAGTGLVTEPGAMLRTVQLRQPGGPFQLELVEWTGTPLRPNTPRIQDPGEVMLAMNVRDMDGKIAAAKRMGLQVMTRNGEPFANEGRNGARNRAIMIKEPSGFIVELTDSSAPPAANAPAGPILSVGTYITVQDLAQTVSFYNRTFGMDMMAPAGATPTTERVKALFNDPSLTTMRTARGTFPGTEFTLNFQEFNVPGRQPARHRVQDPGGPILLVNVTDVRGALEQVRANGGVIGQGATSDPIPAEPRATWVRDPNGVLIRISPPPQPRAGGPAR